MTHSERAAAAGITLPAVAKPVGKYVPAQRAGDRIITSGQLPFADGKLPWTGKVPNQVSVEDAAEAARVAVLNAIAAAADVAGGLDNIKQVMHVTVYVASAPDFFAQPQVANAASDLVGTIFGDAGLHARAALGVMALPMNSPVEVDIAVGV
jgi:enamine deaminase RidA (YjgF/YER057c/UK114 family)